MLVSILNFYRGDKLIKKVDSDEYDHLNKEDLNDFIESSAIKIGADKVVETACYHNHHSGIESIVFDAYSKDVR